MAAQLRSPSRSASASVTDSPVDHMAMTTDSPLAVRPMGSTWGEHLAGGAQGWETCENVEAGSWFEILALNQDDFEGDDSLVIGIKNGFVIINLMVGCG